MIASSDRMEVLDFIASHYVIPEKNVLISDKIEVGDITKGTDGRLKGNYMIEFSNIPSNIQIFIYNDYVSEVFTAEKSKNSSIMGGIYTISYKSIECSDNTLKKSEIYLPIYNPVSEKNVIWNDSTLIKDINYGKSNTLKSILLIIILIIIIGLLSVILIYIFKQKKGAKYEG